VGDSLRGARVALLEARMESELASLVRRHGGEPVCVPALREVERECAEEVRLAIDAAERGAAVVVLATGVGLARWIAVAQTLGRADALRGGLAHATVVCRGPKPVAVLKREGLQAHVRAAAPHTTKELLAALDGVDVRAREAIVVHDGGASHAVPDALARRGARVLEVQPYLWALPNDLEPLRRLVRQVIAGGVDAVAVTTRVQATHLFEVAQAMGLRGGLADALGGRVVVAAVGPTCARALEELGAPPHVVPDQAKMGAMVMALAARLSAGHSQ
jgi:uroporphyrinogen-III synthase